MKKSNHKEPYLRDARAKTIKKQTVGLCLPVPTTAVRDGFQPDFKDFFFPRR